MKLPKLPWSIQQHRTFTPAGKLLEEQTYRHNTNDAATLKTVTTENKIPKPLSEPEECSGAAYKYKLLHQHRISWRAGLQRITQSLKCLNTQLLRGNTELLSTYMFQKFVSKLCSCFSKENIIHKNYISASNVLTLLTFWISIWVKEEQHTCKQGCNLQKSTYSCNPYLDPNKAAASCLEDFLTRP